MGTPENLAENATALLLEMKSDSIQHPNALLRTERAVRVTSESVEAYKNHQLSANDRYITLMVVISRIRSSGILRGVDC
jgi:hypothetical protein